MGSGQFLWLLSCLLQESNKKKDGCSVHGILQWVCLVQNDSFTGERTIGGAEVPLPRAPYSLAASLLGGRFVK